MKGINDHWSWYFSALFYRYSYFRNAHQVDDDLFHFLGKRLQGARVADCGCGPGIVTEKFLARGATKVFAIDVNPIMLRQVKHRLSVYIESGQLETISSPFSPDLFLDLADHRTGIEPNIVLFKRSLYSQPDHSRKILEAAYNCLSPQGVLAIIHPERSLKRYAFGSEMKIRSYSVYHLFNRTISLLANSLGIGQYAVYDQAGLMALMRSAIPGGEVFSIPTSQSAYNVVAAIKQ